MYILKKNDFFFLYRKEYQVIEFEPPKIFVQSKYDNQIEEYNFFDLIFNSSFEINSKSKKSLRKQIDKERKEYFSVLDSLSEEKREQVSLKLEMIRPVLVLEKVSSDIKAAIEFKERYYEYILDGETLKDITKKKLFQRISAKYGKSIRQLERYLTNYHFEENQLNGQGIEGLIRKRDRGSTIRNDTYIIEICHPREPNVSVGMIQTRLDKRYIPIVKEIIEDEYLTLKRVSVQAITEFIETRCIKDNLDPLSYSTVYYMLKQLNEKNVVEIRDGVEEAEKLNAVQRGFSNEEAKYPLHIVQIDHTQLDIDVIDENSGFTIGRPYITLGIDVYTRMVWCMHVSFEHPSGNKVRKAIEHGVLFKYTKQQYKTNNEWDMYGIPKIIFMDNGPEFKNNDIKRVIKETLGAEDRYRPVSTPRYGATIERLIGTINSQLIHRLDGTRKSNITELGEYGAEKEALYTLEDIIELLTCYITDIYHHKVHKGLPLDCCTPAMRYYEGLNKVGFPEWIPEDEIESFKIDLLPIEQRLYTRDGLRFGNVFYKAESLAYMIGLKEKCKFKYDIDDISKIYIFCKKSKQYIEALASNPDASELVGVSRELYKRLRKLLREQGKLKMKSIPGSNQLQQSKAEFKERINKRAKKRRKERQLKSKLNLDQPANVPNPVTVPRKDNEKISHLLNLLRNEQSKGGENIE